MRPYQVYATKRVLDKIQRTNFNYEHGRFGYIWHTTGSGKTITSFKTAWLASRLANVEKVIFLVDRLALTKQTAENYKAYDPISDDSGIINDTKNTRDLHRKLHQKTDKNIIVTSTQKMSRYIESDYFKEPEGNILFIVDEAHRSTGDGNSEDTMIERIRKKIPKSGWVGYTGTPKFEETARIFGKPLHTYTIKEAIADRNVLGFNVSFEDTIPVENITNDEFNKITKKQKATVYDESEKHLNLVAEDIFNHWEERSNNRKYNAMLTVRVGGGKASTPRAMQYFEKFTELNKQLPPEKRLKIAVSFSLDNSNGNNQLANNNNLFKAIKAYNETFKTSYDLSEAQSYLEDIQDRLAKKSEDGNYLDLVIVVDQLLTGFDAPCLNTLYVDRTLQTHSLIQAYSRTNRVHNFVEKPYGKIVNYRWPKQNEKFMEEAISLYSDRFSASTTNGGSTQQELIDSGVLAQPFKDVKIELKNVITKLRKLTENFNHLSPSEREQKETFENLKTYNSLMNSIKQFTKDEHGKEISAYTKPDEFYKMLEITQEEESKLFVVKKELQRRMAKDESVDISQINLEMTHIHEVEVNYDYISELIAKMANQVELKNFEEAEKTQAELEQEISRSKDEHKKNKLFNFIEKIFSKEFRFKDYPVKLSIGDVFKAIERSEKETASVLIDEFINHWAIQETTTAEEIAKLIAKHKLGKKELDKRGELNQIRLKNQKNRHHNPNPQIASLSVVEWRNKFTEAFYELADKIKGAE